MDFFKRILLGVTWKSLPLKIKNKKIKKIIKSVSDKALLNIAYLTISLPRIFSTSPTLSLSLQFSYLTPNATKHCTANLFPRLNTLNSFFINVSLHTDAEGGKGGGNPRRSVILKNRTDFTGMSTRNCGGVKKGRREEKRGGETYHVTGVGDIRNELHETC